jgi:hypothetical protein
VGRLPACRTLEVMTTMTIKNKELHKLYLIIGFVMSLVILLISQTVSNWFYLGFPIVIAIMSNTSGVQFDFKNKMYRKYKHFCFWTRGEWKSIGNNKELVVLVKHGVQTTAGTMMTASLKTKGGFSELYLMDESHLRRFFIDSSEDHNSVELLANKLGELLEIEVKPYRPRKT